MSQPELSPIDHLILSFDTALRTLSGNVKKTQRANPAECIEPETSLSATETQLSGRLMRINHAGEVSAQGLYQGQALTARLSDVKTQMEQAALEENDHLSWCRTRAHELDTSVSILDPVWYLGSMAIGAAAGLAGDKWSLGFVAETEKQVVKHLDNHLQQMSPKDEKSRAILTQMRIDEGKHATTAQRAGAADLPRPVKLAMTMMSKVMTRSSYWV